MLGYEILMGKRAVLKSCQNKRLKILEKNGSDIPLVEMYPYESAPKIRFLLQKTEQFGVRVCQAAAFCFIQTRKHTGSFIFLYK